MIILETTFGNIKIKLDHKNTPDTADNFLDYVKSGHYDNTIFHRVINGFMVQGGGFETGFTEKETGAPIENEADKGKSNQTGTVAMARTSDPHSASAQFFINVADNDFLDHKGKNPAGWGYCVFGEVVDGMNVVNKIKEVETGRNGMHDDVPLEEVIITKAYEAVEEQA